MGGYSQTVAIGFGWKDTKFRSCQAHYVGISPEEDRCGTKSAVGEVPSAAEEGCLDDWGACCGKHAVGFHFQCPSIFPQPSGF
jgi:hypothetical protein